MALPDRDKTLPDRDKGSLHDTLPWSDVVKPHINEKPFNAGINEFFCVLRNYFSHDVIHVSIEKSSS